MQSKTFTIGDIHGCARELEVLLRRLEQDGGLCPGDRLVFLGDYVDRGPDSFQVIELLLSLPANFDCHFLMGNHELFFLQHLFHPGSPHEDVWLQCGGTETLSSYGQVLFGDDLPRALRPEMLPVEHLKFLEAGLAYYETTIDDTVHFFSHAQPPSVLHSLEEVRQLAEEPPFESPLYWGKERPKEALRLPDVVFYSGHTPQNDVFDDGETAYLDTGCCYGKKLSAMEIVSRRIFHADAGESVDEAS